MDKSFIVNRVTNKALKDSKQQTGSTVRLYNLAPRHVALQLRTFNTRKDGYLGEFRIATAFMDVAQIDHLIAQLQAARQEATTPAPEYIAPPSVR